MAERLSIIMPVLNEEARIAAFCQQSPRARSRAGVQS